MTCREFIEFLWRYLSEELSAEERAKFEAHLAQCQPCTSYLSSYKETILLDKASFAHPDDPVLDEAPEELVRTILASRVR